jgi:hypothetical protein
VLDVVQVVVAGPGSRSGWRRPGHSDH